MLLDEVKSGEPAIWYRTLRAYKTDRIDEIPCRILRRHKHRVEIEYRDVVGPKIRYVLAENLEPLYAANPKEVDLS